MHADIARFLGKRYQHGRIVIPAKMRSAMLIDGSGYLTARVVEGELRVLTPRVAVLKLQQSIIRRSLRSW